MYSFDYKRDVKNIFVSFRLHAEFKRFPLKSMQKDLSDMHKEKVSNIYEKGFLVKLSTVVKELPYFALRRTPSLSYSDGHL